MSQKIYPAIDISANNLASLLCRTKINLRPLSPASSCQFNVPVGLLCEFLNAGRIAGVKKPVARF